MENQNIEYKASWHDEYFKWICGFANAGGGKIYIGINDKGIVSGVSDIKKLMEDIPNRTKDLLGIIVDVNAKTKSKLQYLEIIVEPYPYPVSYHGKYHYRSGSTKQELKGAALDKFLLRKQGKCWDGVPIPGIALKELSRDAFTYFKNKASEAKRTTPEVLKEKPDVLLEKLHLKTDSGYFKRAVILLFHPDPEKYVTGAYVKIGFFRSDDDLVYQDEVHGNLFSQMDKTMDLLLTKYMQATISYKGLHRIETNPVPETALREALLNALVHKDYSSGNPIQISVYANKIIIWNQGQLPDEWTTENLKVKHPSQPFNPDIANCFFRAGLIEAWGRGTIKIINECKTAKVATPVFNYDFSGLMIEFRYSNPSSTEINSPITIITTSERVLFQIKHNDSITTAELAKKIGVSQISIKRALKVLQDSKRIIREGSDKTGKWKIINQ